IAYPRGDENTRPGFDNGRAKFPPHRHIHVLSAIEAICNFIQYSAQHDWHAVRNGAKGENINAVMLCP
ncbi:hypothetical protein VNX24_17285, partial [Citrobacter farmeri]|uniref:hypothetical protein n=1 Tax=Citrobacter farmeri TaxID=67824 RepID=UPI002DD07831|nr:hypothetical protein [Citrobacter farmeri]